MLKRTKKSSAKPSRWQEIYQTYQYKLISILSIAVFLIVWELIPNLGLVKPLFISSPSRIWQAAEWLFANGFWHDIQVSAVEFGVGYVLAILFGIPFGICLGWYPKLNAIFDPFVSFLHATPRIALLPLLLLWLGIGVESKIAVVFLGAVFPVLINIMTSLGTIDPILLKCARSFGANDFQILITLAIPNSIPFAIAGMRLAVGRALVGVVVGELVASTAGVGHMMRIAGGSFQTDKVFVGVILLGSVGYFLTELLRQIESRFEQWRPTQQRANSRM